MPRLRFIAWNRQPDRLWGRPEYRAPPVTDFKQMIIAGYACDYGTSSFPHAPSFRLTICDRFERLLVCTVNFLWALLTQNRISYKCMHVCACILFYDMKTSSFMIYTIGDSYPNYDIAVWMMKYKIKHVSFYINI